MGCPRAGASSPGDTLRRVGVILLLDTGVLGRLCNPTAERVRPYSFWLIEFLERSDANRAVVPEIADFELRRELVRSARAAGLQRTRQIDKLDALSTRLQYLPVTTVDWRRASDLWADSRNEGRPSASPAALDGDVILAAQAIRVGAGIATFNRRHLSRFGVEVVVPEPPT